MHHIPVLLQECLHALIPHDKTIERAIDGTLGAGGHTSALIEAGAQQVLAFDVDPHAISIARQRLAPYAERVHIIHDTYANMTQHARALGWGEGVDAILLDLGASSMQFDTPERGFAFMHDAPLDMRFNTDGNQPTASDIVNTWSPEALADMLWRYGEERESRRIARAIIAHRPIHTTQQLADLIAQTMPSRPRKGKKQTPTIHPATRTFQALRIAVNDELNIIERTLPMAIDLLRPTGRLAVISFHSLEDRLVKQAFKEASESFISPPGMASLPSKHATTDLITRKPITATETETHANPRARSAKLRVVQKR